jgi:hypothetical protein
MRREETRTFFIGSREHRGEWSQIRTAQLVEVTNDKHGTVHLWLRLDPALYDDKTRRRIDRVVVGPHFEGDRLWPDPHLPIPVYVYVAKQGNEQKSKPFDPADFELVAWAELYGNRAETEKGQESAS